MSITDSRPCPERCPICAGKCFGGAIGHTSAATCGAKTIPQVHTCVKHCWGTLAQMHEMLRFNTKATERECEENMGKRLKSARVMQYEAQMGNRPV